MLFGSKIESEILVQFFPFIMSLSTVAVRGCPSGRKVSVQ